MKKRTSGLLVNLLLGFMLFALLSCNQEQETNVVLIVVDDLGYADMSCTGLANDVSTPNIDRLAESGIRFTQAYATSPICSPSRAGLLTGCYHQRWGTWWYGGPGIHDNSFPTLAEVLKDHGYATGYIGKIHYGWNDSDTTDRSFPLNHGFDYYFGHTSARKHYLIHDQDYEDRFQAVKKENERRGQSLRQQGLWVNTGKLDTLAFSTELFANEACSYIRKNEDKKFFLQLSFNAVHNFTHQLPDAYLREHNLEGYTDWDPAVEEYYEWYKKGRYPNNPEGRAHYLGQLYYLDREIGKVINCLESSDLIENTLIVLIGDNGGSTPIYANNYPLRGSKYLLYEGGIRVPMMVAYPEKYETGKIRNNVVSAMDLFPTVCRLAGIQSPESIDGKDLSTLLTGADTTLRHDTLVWDTKHEVAVLAGKWKYHLAKSNGHATYEMVDLEVGEFLYDLEGDPRETNNLAGQFPDTLLILKDHHASWRKGMVEKVQ